MLRVHHLSNSIPARNANKRDFVQGDRKMVGSTGALARIGKLALNRRLNLFAEMIYELRHGLKSNLAKRTTWNSHRSSAVGHRLLEEIEAMLVEFDADNLKNSCSVRFTKTCTSGVSTQCRGLRGTRE